ncbi:hypothetical protein SEUCBS139899_000857 [Sporothrix eucalyptigena]|uniref:Uncharacterized protein n=1 Tax=Sporothrix eucalyptigena TaxID=1812306 RepID=A0ABP0BZB7_9PEZI
MLSRASSMAVSVSSRASTLSVAPSPIRRRASFPNMPFMQPAWFSSPTSHLNWVLNSYLRKDIAYERLATGNSPHSGNFPVASTLLDQHVGMVRSTSDYIPVYNSEVRNIDGNAAAVGSFITHFFSVQPKRPTWPLDMKEAIRVGVHGFEM